MAREDGAVKDAWIMGARFETEENEGGACLFRTSDGGSV
jgi:hypothetical protein